jgi:hypothetical protein
MFQKQLTLTGKYLFSCRIIKVYASWLNGRYEIADKMTMSKFYALANLHASDWGFYLAIEK